MESYNFFDNGLLFTYSKEDVQYNETGKMTEKSVYKYSGEINNDNSRDYVYRARFVAAEESDLPPKYVARGELVASFYGGNYGHITDTEKALLDFSTIEEWIP